MNTISYVSVIALAFAVSTATAGPPRGPMDFSRVDYAALEARQAQVRYKQIDGAWHSALARRFGQYMVVPGEVTVRLKPGASCHQEGTIAFWGMDAALTTRVVMLQ